MRFDIMIIALNNPKPQAILILRHNEICSLEVSTKLPAVLAARWTNFISNEAFSAGKLSEEIKPDGII